VTTVVVDALSVRLGGGLTYTGSQLAALARVRPDLDVRVLVAPGEGGRALATRLDGSDLRIPVTGGTVRRVVWEQLRLARAAPSGSVLHCPGNVAPLQHGTVPVVLVVQNPNAFGPGRHESWNRSPRRRARIAIMRASASAATRIVAVSRSMADLVVGDHPELAERVVVVQDGAPSWDLPAVAPVGLAVEPGSYLLSVAQDWPHKRLDALVAAWSAAFAGRARVTPLVMVGEVSESVRARREALVVPTVRPHLHQVGGVADRGQLRWLLEHAQASVSVSALEAHPHGPAEAGALGCPLVLSDIPPHHEVSAPARRGAVRFVGRLDVDALVEAMREPPAERTPWRWPCSWDDNARHLATCFDELAG
jgi:glycosyltransferase involved in cell wall biosynthesis